MFNPFLVLDNFISLVGHCHRLRGAQQPTKCSRSQCESCCCVESRRIDIHNVHNGAGGSQQNICLDRADVTGLGDVIVPLHNNNVSCCDLQCQWRHFLTHRTPSACRPPPPPPPACASALCSQLPASWTRPASIRGRDSLCYIIHNNDIVGFCTRYNIIWVKLFSHI